MRFSLTLRIAAHSSLQLIRTMLMIAILFTIVFSVAQAPVVSRSFDAVEAMTPGEDGVISVDQLAYLPVIEAYYVEVPFTDDLSGFMDRVALTAERMFDAGFTQLALYRATGNGGLVVVFDMQDWMHVYLLSLLALAIADLYRIVYFLRHRRRLNRHVLKPIADMTVAAEKMSANNLSDRINLAGTKNEFKDLAAVINKMLDRIERSYNSQKAVCQRCVA